MANDNQNTENIQANEEQTTVQVTQVEKKPGMIKRTRQKTKDDLKRATQVEDGSIIKAVTDLWRMLFPKK